MIYNPYFDKHGIDAVVVPMGCKAEDYPAFLQARVQALEHPRRARHHAAQGDDGRRCSTRSRPTAKVAGSCNAVRLGAGRPLVGDMFDGEGFVRGVLRKGRELAGARVLVVGARRRRLGDRGVARQGRRRRARAVRRLCADDGGLAERLRAHYPALKVAHRLERSGRASTSSSTPRRSA